MTEAHRKHVVVPTQTLRFLEEYQRRHRLPSFSAAIEAAAQALRQSELRLAYEQFARDYAREEQEQAEAQAWLDFPMQEASQEGR